MAWCEEEGTERYPWVNEPAGQRQKISKKQSRLNVPPHTRNFRRLPGRGLRSGDGSALFLQELQNFLRMRFGVLNRGPMAQDFAVGPDHDGRTNNSLYGLAFRVFSLSPRPITLHDFGLRIG